jgi:hypothetical protein
MTLLGMGRQRGLWYQELEDEGPYDRPEKTNVSAAGGDTCHAYGLVQQSMEIVSTEVPVL